jgi:hypothetical protein|tara:strand:+ start:423 stop:566 length:144 start_codon:yes stop_codon:yes gene_type:complete
VLKVIPITLPNVPSRSSGLKIDNVKPVIKSPAITIKKNFMELKVTLI